MDTIENVEARLISLCQTLVESGAFEKAEMEAAFKGALLSAAVKYSLWGVIEQ